MDYNLDKCIIGYIYNIEQILMLFTFTILIQSMLFYSKHKSNRTVL